MRDVTAAFLFLSSSFILFYFVSFKWDRHTPNSRDRSYQGVFCLETKPRKSGKKVRTNNPAPIAHALDSYQNLHSNYFATPFSVDFMSRFCIYRHGRDVWWVNGRTWWTWGSLPTEMIRRWFYRSRTDVDPKTNICEPSPGAAGPNYRWFWVISTFSQFFLAFGSTR